VKIYLKKINNEYLIETDYYSSITIEIDGKRFLEFNRGWTQQKPKTIKIIEKKTRVIYYGELTPEEYKIEIDKLIPKIDEDGYPVFENLEQEYKYKKFLECHKAVYENFEEKIDPEIIELDITGRTDNEFIIPFRFLGKKEIKDNEILYKYEPYPYKIAQKIASDFGFIEIAGDNTIGMQWSTPEHSRKDLQYTKIAGRYAGYDSLPKFYGISCGTWKECEETFNKHYNAIKDMFQKEIDRLNMVGKEYDKAKVLDELNLLKNMISKIDAKSKSTIKPWVIVTKINEFIKNL